MTEKDHTGADDDYRESHQESSKPAQYDPKFFDSATVVGLMWEIEKTIISETVSGMSIAPKRALDFACGTGRILSHVEDLVPETFGVDVSAAMLGVARERCKKATLIEADLSVDRDRVTGTFDLITSFRFLLNAQDRLRSSVLKSLRAKIADNGLLIVNFHRNPNSLTGMYLRAVGRLRGRENPNMIDLADAIQLLRSNGFEPEIVRGYGYLLHRTERVPFAPLVSAIEKKLADWNLLASIAQNFIVAARPIPSRGQSRA